MHKRCLFCARKKDGTCCCRDCGNRCKTEPKGGKNSNQELEINPKGSEGDEVSNWVAPHTFIYLNDGEIINILQKINEALLLRSETFQLVNSLKTEADKLFIIADHVRYMQAAMPPDELVSNQHMIIEKVGLRPFESLKKKNEKSNLNTKLKKEEENANENGD